MTSSVENDFLKRTGVRCKHHCLPCCHCLASLSVTPDVEYVQSRSQRAAQNKKKKTLPSWKKPFLYALKNNLFTGHIPLLLPVYVFKNSGAVTVTPEAENNKK